MKEAESKSPADPQPLPAGMSLFDEAASFFGKQPDKALFGGLLVLWIGLFHFFGNSTLGYVDTPSLFGWMHYAYENNLDDEHGLYVPLVVLFLIFWRSDELERVEKRLWWPGLLLLLVALAIHLVGFQVQQTRISIVAFYAGLYALTGLVWGPRWMAATFFPFVLFAFCVPLGNKSTVITQPLRQLATDITAVMAQGPLGIDVIQNGTTIFDPTGKFSYEIAAACSGLRSLTAISALAITFAFLWFKPWWKRIVMIAAAVPLAIGSNVFRLLSIIVAAEAFGQPAGNFVHDNSMMSLLPYLPAFAGLLVMALILDGRIVTIVRMLFSKDTTAEGDG
jgi:exosortase